MPKKNTRQRISPPLAAEIRKHAAEIAKGFADIKKNLRNVPPLSEDFRQHGPVDDLLALIATHRSNKYATRLRRG